MSTFLDATPATRGLSLGFLTESGHTLTSTFASDSGGGATETRASGGTIACRLDALGGSEAQVADRISDRSTHTITFEPNAAITVADQFVLDGKGTFEVTAVRNQTDELVRIVEAVSAS